MAEDKDKPRESSPGPERKIGPEGAGTQPSSTADRDQPSALGGEVATRSRAKQDDERG